MIVMFIVHTPRRVYKRKDIWVCMCEKGKEWTRHYCVTKDHFISKIISLYTKDFLTPRTRVQEFLHYFDKPYITGTSTVLQLFSSKSGGHGYTAGQILSTVFSYSGIALMVNVRKCATISSSSMDRLELM